MAVTILEALQNADHNVQSGHSISLMLAKEQLNNAVTLLEKGYDLDDEVETLLGELESVDEVPEKDAIDEIKQSLSSSDVNLSLSDAKQKVAVLYGKENWADVSRDYEYGLGISKMMDFEELIDKVAEVYKKQ